MKLQDCTSGDLQIQDGTSGDLQIQDGTSGDMKITRWYYIIVGVDMLHTNMLSQT